MRFDYVETVKTDAIMWFFDIVIKICRRSTTYLHSKDSFGLHDIARFFLLQVHLFRAIFFQIRNGYRVHPHCRFDS